MEPLLDIAVKGQRIKEQKRIMLTDEFWYSEGSEILSHDCKVGESL